MPISDGNMIQYFQVNGIDQPEWAHISEFVSAIDDIWLTEHFAAADKASKRA